MELNASKTSSAALLNCGNTRGFSEKLLLKPTPGRPQTERVPRSSVLERLQTFLPQMAEANEKLRRQMEAAPPEQFDIENVEEAPRVIHMDVSLVELDDSDGGSERDSDDSESDSDSDEDEGGVTEENLRLPGDERKRRRSNAQIQVLQEEEEEK